MKKIRINVLYATKSSGHGVATAFAEMVRGLRARPDTIVTTNSWRPADIVHFHSPHPSALLRLWFGRGVKVISGHLTRGSMVGSVKKWLVPLEFWYYKNLFYRRADAMVAVSATTRENLIKEFKIQRPIAVVENSIDTAALKTTAAQKATLRRQLDYGAQDFIIASNGQIQPRKKFDEFVRAAQQLPEFKFIWIGGIPFKGVAAEQSKMEKLIKTAPENVLVTGVVPLDLARRYLRLSDVYFHPASQETFGIAIIEGAAAGLPVVLRAIADYDQTFGDQAILSRPEQFVQVLKRLSSDKAYYDAAKKRSAIIAARYDNQTAAEKYVAFYKQLLSERGRA